MCTLLRLCIVAQNIRENIPLIGPFRGLTVDEQNPAPPLILVFWKCLVDNPPTPWGQQACGVIVVLELGVQRGGPMGQIAPYPFPPSPREVLKTPVAANL